MKKNFYLLITISLITLSACQDQSSSNWKEKDLMEYGFAVTVLAPDSLVVKKNDLVFMQDLTLKGENGYNMQIFMSEASTNDISTLVSKKKADVRSGRYFSKFVEEYEDGFIFEKDIDGVMNYDFRRMKVFGDKEYEFRAALIGSFTEDDVRAMYKAVTDK